MKKQKLKLTLTLVMFLFSAMSIFAQTRTVTGTVYNEESVRFRGVTITVVGSTTQTSTDDNGNYSIVVPENASLRFTAVGYETQTVAVGSRSTVIVNLEKSVSELGEVVVTAEFGMKRVGRAIGSSVQQIDGAVIAESGRDAFITALAGRVPGLNVSSTSGTPGASTTVVLRNITSISGNNQPLYVVDGVPMNNSTFDPINLAGAETYSVRNLDFSSRGNDFNPEDIASITVLKGAAAAALYGSDASNGAIIITTKKGRPGKGRVQYSNSFKWDNAYGYPELQDKYANGNYGATNYYNTAKFGGEYPAGMKLYDNFAAVLQTGFTQRHNVSVEGGSETGTIRATFSHLDQEGVIKTTDYGRTSLSLSGQATITDWLHFEGSMQYSRTANNKVMRGTDGPLYRSMIWPMVDDMSVYLDADGSHMRVPDYYLDQDLLNPLFAMHKNKNFDSSDRLISNVAFNLTPIEHTFFRAQMGWDFGMQSFTSSWHPYYSARNAGLGRYDFTQSNFSDPTINVLAGYNNTFLNDKLSFSGQVGYHQMENAVTRQSTNGSRFLVADFQSINNVDPATMAAKQRNTKRRIQAISAQLEFGYNNLAFVTLRARNDWSSTLPVKNNQYFYPSIEGSLILSDLEFFKSIEAISYFKLRGSLAQVGKDAGPLEIDPQLEPTLLTGGGYKYGFTGPNPNLRPEITTAHEGGFDLSLFGNRLNTGFTYFGTRNDDQIVKSFRLSYATGFVLNTLNVGSFKTWGWEAHIDGDIIKKPDGVTWNVGINMSQNKSEVLSLPENVTEYYNPYTWNSGNLRNGISVGNPVTTMTGYAYQRNDAGDILISPTTGLPLTAGTWSIVGDREPTLRFGATTSLRYKDFRASALFAGRVGATVVNGTKRLMMSQGTSWESVNLRESGPFVFKGVVRDGLENTANPTVNTIVTDYRQYGATIFTGGDEDWLEKNVNYLRLQELRLSYRIPAQSLAWSRIASGMDVFMVANDLATWTNYSGFDAVGNTVSAAAGGTGGEGIDILSIPNPRGFSIGVSLTLN